MRRAHKEAEAYFTVEAALVMPVVLCIFVMLLYLSFYLYDRCVLAQDCYVLSYRQSIEKGGADRSGPDAARAKYGGRLFMLSKITAESSDGGTVQVSGQARMDVPVFGLGFFDRNQGWDLVVKERAKKTDPPKDYRRVRRILSAAKRAAAQ